MSPGLTLGGCRGSIDGLSWRMAPRSAFGVHGPVKVHYGLDSEPNLPLPVDYLAASAAG